ncbi:hypothetical protein SpCBS45565_g02770 [Spizellomyces sp. 'palustris']|nr:hypothetical protein SpCBS45565_g02770 [Spizellomyces sp. 'palustris']
MASRQRMKHEILHIPAPPSFSSDAASEASTDEVTLNVSDDEKHSSTRNIDVPIIPLARTSTGGSLTKAQPHAVSPSPLPVSPPEQKKVARKLDYLEGLRGLAACIVLNEHFTLYNLSYDQTTKENWGKIGYQFGKVFVAGKLAVSLFFILSGRVLAIAYLKKPDSDRLASAFFRRPFRLIIPVFGSLLIHWAVYRLNWYAPVHDAASVLDSWRSAEGTVKSFEEPTLSNAILNTLTLFVPGGRSVNYPHAPQWTIGIELQGSFLVFIVALITQSYFRHRWVIYAVLVFWFFWTETWFADFMVGLWLADLAQSGFFGRIQSSRLIWPFRLALVFLTLITMVQFPKLSDKLSEWSAGWSFDTGKAAIGRDSQPPWYQFHINYFYSSTCFALLLEVTPLLQRVFEISPIKFLGRVSFGMYLLHPVVFLTFGSIMVSIIFRGLPGRPWWLKVGLVYCSTFAMILVVSWLFYKTFDQWSVDFGRWLETLMKAEWSVKSFTAWTRKRAKANSPAAWRAWSWRTWRTIKSYPRRKYAIFKGSICRYRRRTLEGQV